MTSPGAGPASAAPGPSLAASSSSSSSTATVDPATLYARVRKLVSTVEFQLQQIEADGTGLQAFTQAQEDAALQKRHELTENLNLLTRELAGLDRLVQDPRGPVSAAGANAGRRDLWLKRVQQMQAEVSQLRRSVEQLLRASFVRSSAAGGPGGGSGVSNRYGRDRDMLFSNQVRRGGGGGKSGWRQGPATRHAQMGVFSAVQVVLLHSLLPPPLCSHSSVPLSLSASGPLTFLSTSLLCRPPLPQLWLWTHCWERGAP